MEIRDRRKNSRNTGRLNCQLRLMMWGNFVCPESPRISVPNLPDALAPNLSEAIQTDRRPAFAFSREIQFFLCFQTELALSRERIRGYRSQSSPTHL
jgi:hypothetical protein